MTIHTWQMQERFSFPQELGVPKKITAVRITPQWQEEVLEESIRLTGIYHIAAQVAFREGEVQAADGVFISELDVGDEDSYFEYALPLEVDLAKHVQGDVLLHVAQVDSAIEDGQTLLTWQMKCSYEEAEEPVVAELVSEPQVVEQELLVEKEVYVEDEIVFEQVPAVHEDDFYKELAEAYTVFQTNLNKVRRE